MQRAATAAAVAAAAVAFTGFSSSPGTSA